MGKHKRKREEDDIRALVKRIKRLEKENRAPQKPAPTRTPTPTRSASKERAAPAQPPRYRRVLPLSPYTSDDEPEISEAVPNEANQSPVPIEAGTMPDTMGNEMDHSDEEEEILGEDPSEVKTYSAPVRESLVSRWKYVVDTGLTKDQRGEIRKTYLMPENMANILEAPTLNIELKKAVSDIVSKKDQLLQSHQEVLGRATASIGVAIDHLMKTKGNKEIKKTLNDTGRLLCDLFHMQSNSRRALITFALNKETKDIVSDHKVSDKLLFGGNLMEALKSGKAINKLGPELQYTRQPDVANKRQAPLNYRGPPRRYTRPQPPTAGRPAPAPYRPGPRLPAPPTRGPGRHYHQRHQSYRHRR